MLVKQYAHLIEIANVPFIEKTRYKVIDLALMVLAYGWSPDEIHRCHPDLTKAQICSALAYYYDHQEEMDEQILKEEEMIQQIKENSSQQPSRLTLLARLKK
jgi:uncharacterized protein (DUF433 family)